MAETTTNKPKLQLRSGFANSSDKTPSPATKLLLNHGKPNFTIQKSPKADENGTSSPLSPLAQNNNNNYNAYKSVSVRTNGTTQQSSSNTSSTTITNSTIIKNTKFNGAFNTSNVTVNEKQIHQSAAPTTSATENEASKVVLRRTVREAVAAEPPIREDEDDSVPEFIRRQRRIQERLAKENLDFESRRSGYFTHVVISPTATTSRTSYMETMASPAVNPSLEIPPPKREETPAVAPRTNGISAATAHVAHIVEEEEEEAEVARAIEEVNKAVAGEEDEHHSEVAVHAITTHSAYVEEEEEEKQKEHVSAVAHTAADHEEAEVTISHTNSAATLQHASGALIVNGSEDHGHEYAGTDIVQVVHATPAIAVLKNGTDVSSLNASEHVSGALVVNAVEDHATAAAVAVVQHSSGALTVNGVSGDGEPEHTVQVVHAAAESTAPVELQNGVDVSSIQVSTHASGALVVDEAAAELEAMSKLKFEIKAEGDDHQHVEVTPALRTE